MAEQEWYTIQEIADQTNIPYPKVRSAIFVLKNQGTITVRDNPRDARVTEINKTALPAIRQALGL